MTSGTPTKESCLAYTRNAEKDNSSVETRIKFCTSYDEEQIIQPKSNQFADIILRKGNIVVLDSATSETSVVSEEDFLKQ